MKRSSDMPQEEKRPERSKSSRKKVKILILVAVCIIALAVAAVWLDPDRITDRIFHHEPIENPSPVDFYPVELSEGVDILADPEYLALDRRIHYADPYTGAVYSLEEEELSTCEPYLRFLYSYFNSAIRGNAAEYATFFAPEYDRSALPTSFTMQQIYDISVRRVLGTEENDGTETYLISYKIRQNNGTFRSDIGSDAERAQLFRLTERDGTLMIVSIVPYTSYR